MLDTCNGCAALKVEDWPRNMKACRCMNVLRGKWFGRVVGNPYPADIETPWIYRPAWCDGKEEDMSEYLDKAIAKIESDYKSGHYDRYAAAMKTEVKKALISFVSQDEELAQAVVQGGSFDECMKAVAIEAAGEMKKLMEYKIISGSVIEARRAWLPSRDCGTGRKRGLRLAGNSSEKKIRQNEQEAIKQLARLLNANLTKGWMLVTLKYDAAHLPTERDALKKSMAKYLKAVRAAFKAEHGRTPRYFAVNGTWSVKNERPARWHHHIVIEACSRDMLASLWHGGGSVICEDVDNRQDHTALAVYLYRNTERAERGECRWSTSRGNLSKPIYTEPVEVMDGVEGIKPPANATLMDMTRLDDEDGNPISAYIRCVLPERPKVRGGQVILPKPPKRGGRKGG